MNKKLKEYIKKSNRIIRTFIMLGITIFILGVVISIMYFNVKKKRSNENMQLISSGDGSVVSFINIADGDIFYEESIDIILNIQNFIQDNLYRVEINMNGDNIIKEDISISNNSYSINFYNEGEKDLNIIIYINNEQKIVKNLKVYYVKPYQKQFLDEISKKGVVAHYRDGKWEDYTKDIELVKNCGIKYLRTDFIWRAIDKQNGTYDFSAYDKWINRANELDLKIVAILVPNGTISGEDMKINNDDELTRFLKFTEKLAHRYPEILEYEVYNEPNLVSKNTGGTAYTSDEYLQWYAKTIESLRNSFSNINTKINVISGATCTPPTTTDSCMESTEFIKKYSKYGGYKYSNGISYHPYDKRNLAVQNGDFYKKNNLHINCFNELGGFIKAYATEYGVYSANGINEDGQSQKLIQQSVILDNYETDLSILYNLWNTGEDVSNTEYSFGLLYNNYTPKPAYYAMKNYYTNTNGSEYIGTIDLQEGLEFHVYNKDGRPLIITWSNNINNAYDFTLNSIKAKDLYGNDITPDETGKIQITTSPVYLNNADNTYFYQAISNTSITKYDEFVAKFSEQISKVAGVQSSINNLKERMENLSITSNLDETTAINLMKQHYNLGNTIIQAYKAGTLQIEYVTLSSMLDMLNVIGNSYEDLVTVSAKTRNANLTETLKTITEAGKLINDENVEMIYPTKILEFSQDFYDKANYINSLKDENDIKTGLIVSKSLHSKLLANWAQEFANLYIDEYITNTPVEIIYSTTELTNQKVTATLQTNANIIITNNSNSKTYTFEKNGTFTFEYTIKGRAFTKTATVANIDTTLPTIEGVENNKLYTRGITPKIQDENLHQVFLYKNSSLVENYKINDTISEEGHYQLIAKDLATNQTTIEFDICREPAKIQYSTTDLTNQDVTATVVSNYEIEESNQTSYLFTQNGQFTFEFTIKGTTLRLTAAVNNIDKTPPVITGVEENKQYIDKVTPNIQDENLKEVKLYLNSHEVEEYTVGSTITGEGFYKLVATDLAGNETTVEFTIIEKISEEYRIQDNYILNIKNNTQKSEFDKKLDMLIQYEIIRDGNQLAEDDKIATGDLLKTENGEEYTLIINGDINKDGDVNIKDVIKLRKYLLERNNLDEISLLAADCNLDGKSISIKDLIRMRLIVLERDVT